MTVIVPDWALLMLALYLAWDALCNTAVARARKRLVDETVTQMQEVARKLKETEQ